MSDPADQTPELPDVETDPTAKAPEVAPEEETTDPDLESWEGITAGTPESAPDKDEESTE